MLSTLDVNLVYLLLLGALWFSALAIYLPGTGVLEAIALGILAVIFLVLTQQPTNWAAALVLVLGVLVFLTLPLFNSRYGKFAPIGLVLQVLGSMTLFNGSGVSWLSILFAIGVSIAYHQFILLPMMRRLRSLPTENDDDQLEGIEGRVVSALNPTGTVQLRGETWTAYSDRPVESGERVVVIKRDGLQLYVEALKHKHEENGKVQHYE